MNNLKKSAAISTSILAIACHVTAYAQTDTSDNPQSGALASAAASTDSEIVVTAQRRAENLQDVPIAVTAITPAQVTNLGIVTAKDIQLVTPGLNFETSYGYVQPYIRGVGTQSPNPGIESSVAIYIDGIYQPHASGAVTDLFDMSGVQVLRGPQGTLYGRNASGGAILYSYAEPVLGEYSADFVGEYGKRDHIRASGVVNIAVGDTAALRLGAQHIYQDGFITNLVPEFVANATPAELAGIAGLGPNASALNAIPTFGGLKSTNLRAKFKWEPSSSFSVDLTAEHYKSTNLDTYQAQRGPAAFCAACNIPIPGANLNPVAGFYDIAINAHQSARFYKFFRASANLTYTGDTFDINSLSYYTYDRSFLFSDQGGSSTYSLFDFDPDQGGKVYGQELQLISKWDGLINIMVGGSYSHQDDYNDTVFNGIGFGALRDLAISPTILTKSTAGFAEVYVTPTDRLKLTLGGRYTHDNRVIDVDRSVSTQLAFGATANDRNSLTTNVFTHRMVMDYDLDLVHFYASWTSGYKAGGFNSTATAFPPAITPEKINSFEAGAKFVSDDGRIRLNATGFYYKYTNAQVQITNLNAGGQTLANAGDAQGYGAELDGSFQVTPWLNLFGSVSLLDTKYLDYPNASQVIVDPNTGTLINSFVPNLAGTRLPRAPSFIGTAGFNIDHDISDNMSAHLNGVIRYTAGYDFYPAALGPLNFARQPAYELANLSGNIRREMDGPGLKYITVGFYVNNLTNRKYFQLRGTQANFGLFDIVAEPRSFGLRVTAGL